MLTASTWLRTAADGGADDSPYSRRSARRPRPPARAASTAGVWRRQPAAAMRPRHGSDAAALMIASGVCGKACGFWLISCSTSRCSRTSTSCRMSTLRLISIGLSGVLTVMQPVSGSAAARLRRATVFSGLFGHGHLSLGWGWGRLRLVVDRGLGLLVCSSSRRRTSVTIPGTSSSGTRQHGR